MFEDGRSCPVPFLGRAPGLPSRAFPRSVSSRQPGGRNRASRPQDPFPFIRCMKEDARPMTAMQMSARRGWVRIEDRQLKRKTMYWLFWLFLVGSLLISVTHTALS